MEAYSKGECNSALAALSLVSTRSPTFGRDRHSTMTQRTYAMPAFGNSLVVTRLGRSFPPGSIGWHTLEREERYNVAMMIILQLSRFPQKNACVVTGFEGPVYEANSRTAPHYKPKIP